MVNNGKMYIRRVRGDYWAALAMTAILNASPFAEVKHLLWGERVDREALELMIFVWVNAPLDTDCEKFCAAQLDIIDKALDDIPGFKSGGEFRYA